MAVCTAVRQAAVSLSTPSGFGSHRPCCVVGTGMNCASLSCPHLRRRAYTGANLNQELTDQVLSGKRVHRPVRTMLPHRCRPQMESWLQNTQLALNLDRTNNELSLNKVQLDLCCAGACRVCVHVCDGIVDGCPPDILLGFVRVQSLCDSVCDPVCTCRGGELPTVDRWCSGGVILQL